MQGAAALRRNIENFENEKNNQKTCRNNKTLNFYAVRVMHALKNRGKKRQICNPLYACKLRYYLFFLLDISMKVGTRRFENNLLLCTAKLFFFEAIAIIKTHVFNSWFFRASRCVKILSKCMEDFFQFSIDKSDSGINKFLTIFLTYSRDSERQNAIGIFHRKKFIIRFVFK